MLRQISASSVALAALALSWIPPIASEAAPPADWSTIPETRLTLFYPGQSSYEWLRSRAHPGSRMVRRGAACVRCHEGRQRRMGESIVDGGRLEPAPIPGKKGSVQLVVQAAHDDQNLYLRFQWQTQADRPGAMHSYMRYTGSEWEFYGGPRSSEQVRHGQEPPLYEDRLAIMVDDGDIPNFAEQGCWQSCHDDMRDMPDEPSPEEVASHPYLGRDGLGKDDIRKYLPSSRAGRGKDWDSVKPAEAITRIRENGGFADLMQWRAARSNPVDMADDGYVLAYRRSDSGQGPYRWNVDRETMQPRYMFDERTVGRHSLTVGTIGDPSLPVAVIREENAVPYDPDADWEKGDVLPGRLLSRADTRGSAADNDRVRGEWESGKWTIVWTRPLDTGHDDDVAFAEGREYTFGFSVHDDNVTTRFHFVSFPVTLGIGRQADITAVTLD